MHLFLTLNQWSQFYKQYHYAIEVTHSMRKDMLRLANDVSVGADFKWVMLPAGIRSKLSTWLRLYHTPV